jgi:aspartate/methionine/tyrosine aminotransferase
MALISDEVFLDFDHGGGKAMSFAANDAALTFTLGGVSKSLGLPQMKVAWTVVSGPAAAVAEATRRLEFIADTYLTVGTPPQRALPFWLGRSAVIRSEMNVRFSHNRASLEKALKGREGVELLSSEGGWYAVFKIDGAMTDEEFAIHLLKKHSVLVQPGYFYDLAENHAVVSLLPPPWVFDEGLVRLSAALKNLQF